VIKDFKEAAPFWVAFLVRASSRNLIYYSLVYVCFLNNFIYTLYLISRKQKSHSRAATVGLFTGFLVTLNFMSLAIVFSKVSGVDLLGLMLKSHVLYICMILGIAIFFNFYGSYVITKSKGKKINLVVFYSYLVGSVLFFLVSLLLVRRVMPTS